MKYTKEITEKLIEDYKLGVPVSALAQSLDVPERSIIAKLSSLGVYNKKAMSINVVSYQLKNPNILNTLQNFYNVMKKC